VPKGHPHPDYEITSAFAWIGEESTLSLIGSFGGFFGSLELNVLLSQLLISILQFFAGSPQFLFIRLWHNRKHHTFGVGVVQVSVYHNYFKGICASILESVIKTFFGLRGGQVPREIDA